MKKLHEVNGHILYFHEDLNIIHIDWAQFIKKSDMEDMRVHADKILSKEKSPNWIADMSKTTTIDQAGQDFGYNTWVPEVAGKGIVRMATVIPSTALGKLGSKKIVTAFQSTYATCEAASLQDAIQWIKAEAKNQKQVA